MKKITVVIMLAMAIIVGGATVEAKTTKTTKTRTSQSSKKTSGNNAELTKIVKKLWKGIPDHGILKYTESSLTPDFFTLVDMGYAVPTDCPGGIGSEEVMWYWYLEQDWIEGKARILSVTPVSITSDRIVAKVKYTDGFSPRNHEIVLVKDQSDGEWLIDNFDTMRQEIYEYVQEMGSKYAEGYAEEILKDPNIGGYMTDEEKNEYLKEVERFNKKFKTTYPDGIVKK